MKNTVILLIFLISILGLLIGIYYTETSISDSSKDTPLFEVNESDDGVITITYEEKENNDLIKYFT